MSFNAIHPEEMLDRARQRALTAKELAQLQQHLASCPACAAQVQLRADFESLLIDGEADAAYAARLLAKSQGSLLVVPARGKNLLLSRERVWLARVAVVLLGITAGGLATASWWRPLSGGGRYTTSRPSKTLLRPRVSSPSRASTVARPPEAATTRGADELQPEPAVEPKARPSFTFKKSSLTPARKTAVSFQEAPSNRPAVLDDSPLKGVEAKPSLSAKQLLNDATTARRTGRYADALRAFERLSLDFAGSREEMTSRISMAHLLLQEFGNAERASALFATYLREFPQGPLAEEARLGNAVALARLGQRAAADAAWRELLVHHPSSIHAQRAQRALAQSPPSQQ